MHVAQNMPLGWPEGAQRVWDSDCRRTSSGSLAPFRRDALWAPIGRGKTGTGFAIVRSFAKEGSLSWYHFRPSPTSILKNRSRPSPGNWRR
ncbi:hypothetical protein MES5069_860013 [Mesorhizobium escarrei]|uniref:Uncharacterized protein n=1 Tax=Mesorhizobium escarrei TaxID=666018 RepID=A0ABM9EJ20_9HYPH|nr:hypothetical protein MES5069_860013 [Mesorhizobium escarrei]